jgi:hypothetical protein
MLLDSFYRSKTLGLDQTSSMAPVIYTSAAKPQNTPTADRSRTILPGFEYRYGIMG